MTQGGKRNGDGRPKGSIFYGELTKTRRNSLSHISMIKQVIQKNAVSYRRPLYSGKVQAGLPTPIDDSIDTYIDLSEYLIKQPDSTFFLTVSGDSMKDAGINTGDMLIVDKSIDATHGKIVVAAVDGELTVKRLSNQDGKIQLQPENPEFQPLDITEEHYLVIWGVVTHVIHQTI